MGFGCESEFFCHANFYVKVFIHAKKASKGVRYDPDGDPDPVSIHDRDPVTDPDLHKKRYD